MCQTHDEVVEQITQWGIEHAPQEVCGLIHTRRDGFMVYRVTNIAADPCREYTFDASELVEVMAEVPTRNDVICWHTHPGGTVGPSEGDVRRKVRGVRYLVVAIPTGEAVFF